MPDTSPSSLQVNSLRWTDLPKSELFKQFFEAEVGIKAETAKPAWFALWLAWHIYKPTTPEELFRAYLLQFDLMGLQTFTNEARYYNASPWRRYFEVIRHLSPYDKQPE